MMKEHWVAAAFTTDTLVAELLLRLKQSSSSDSSHALPSPATETTTTALLNPIGWGNRKSRSKPSTTATVAVADGFRKEQQQRSPSTPLDWSGGGAGAASTSDGSDESSLPSDLFVGGRSAKVEFASECSPTYIKSRKRKASAGVKEEEDFLLKERGHLKRIDPKRETEQFVQISTCKVEPEIETRERPFVLPDLNMTPSDEELAVP